MTKSTRSTKNASKASQNKKVNKAVEAEEILPEGPVQENESNTAKRPSKNNGENFNERTTYKNIRFLWASILIFFIVSVSGSIFLYFENQNMKKSLSEIVLRHRDISDLLDEEKFAKNIRDQFSKMYFEMVTPDLERKTVIFDERIKKFQNELSFAPTKEELISDLDAVLKESLSKIKEDLNFEISKQIENLNSATKKVFDDLSSSGEVNVGLILQELDEVNREISKIKEDSAYLSSRLMEISSEIERIDGDFLEAKVSLINSSQREDMQFIYLEVQKLLEGIPDLTTLAIRDEYITETLVTTDNKYWARIKAFFGSKITSRSLVPKEGTSVDSIMSRAEDALRGMNLKKALMELQSLPDGAREIFAGVIKRVERLIETLEGGSIQEK